MRRVFFKRLCIVLLILLWIGYAGFIFAAPSEWLYITVVFVSLTLIFAFRMWASDIATMREHGYTIESSKPRDKRIQGDTTLKQ